MSEHPDDEAEEETIEDLEPSEEAQDDVVGGAVNPVGFVAGTVIAQQKGLESDKAT